MYVVSMLLLIVIPLLATTITYYRTKGVFRKFVTSHAGAAYMRRSYANKLLYKLRSFARLLNVIVCGFWVCYTPFIVMSIFMAFSPLELLIKNEPIVDCVLSMVRVILFGNAILNPLVLFIGSKEYRKAFFSTHIFCCCHILREIATNNRSFSSGSNKVSPVPEENQ